MTHHLGTYLFAGPVFDGNLSLIDQHPQAINGGTTLSCSFLDKGGLRRIRDHIGHHHIRFKRGHINRDLGGVWVQPDVGRIDDNVHAFGNLQIAFQRNKFTTCPCFCIHQFSQLLATAWGTIDNDDFGCVFEGTLHGNGTGRPTSSQNEQSLSRNFSNFFEGLGVAFAIGIFPNVLTIAFHHTIHRTHQLGRFTQAIQQRDNLLLVRKRAIKPLVAHGFHTLKSGFQFIRWHFRTNVAVLHTLMLEDGFHHKFGWVFPYGHTKICDECTLAINDLCHNFPPSISS